MCATPFLEVQKPCSKFRRVVFRLLEGWHHQDSGYEKKESARQRAGREVETDNDRGGETRRVQSKVRDRGSPYDQHAILRRSQSTKFSKKRFDFGIYSWKWSRCIYEAKVVCKRRMPGDALKNKATVICSASNLRPSESLKQYPYCAGKIYTVFVYVLFVALM